jgi:hypothetical protein
MSDIKQTPRGLLHQPPNTMPEIGAIWAFLSVDNDGNEGVCACRIGGVIVPLVAADEARLIALREQAEYLAAQSERKIMLVKFSKREVLETLTAAK